MLYHGHCSDFIITICRHVIESLLKEIPEMFADTRESETVLGPVVSSAVQAMKVCAF